MAQYDLNLKNTLSRFQEHTYKFILDPVRWSSLALPYVLNWNTVPFTRASVTTIPDDQVGVYTFVVVPGIANHASCGYLMYVGQTTRQSLRRRFQQYLREQRIKKGRVSVLDMMALFPSHLWFCYAPLPQTTQILQIEADLIRAFVPPINDDYPADMRAPIALWRRR